MDAIVYTSNTGHTAAYARILGDKTGLAVYSLDEACRALPKKAEIVYLGWLFVGGLKGYKKAARRFSVRAVCGVGLCDTGCLEAEVRKAIKLSAEIPLFNMQGGIDKTKLRGIYGYMIDMLIKMMRKKKAPTADDQRMLALLEADCDYVSEDNAAAFLAWYANR
ncbi:MAG: hypothetical protein E7644_03345 [Ruminococcaceae bacterium]|nr:hypothetical protein [Oscillospiraceae bacterium]